MGVCSGEENPGDRALIRGVDPSAPPSGSAATLDRIEQMAGVLTNLHRTAARSPTVLLSMWHQMELGAEWSLSPRQQIAITLRVSQLNCCAYCLAAAVQKARVLGLDDVETRGLRRGESGDDKEKALLDLASKIVEHRGHHVGFEVAAARAAGFPDGEIVEIIHLVGITTTNNYLDCVANTEMDFPPAEDLGLCES